MGKDHSLDYKKKKIYNTAQKRLTNIMNILSHETEIKEKKYLDVGCSNGFITALIAEQFEPRVAYGFDVVESNLEIGRQRHPQVEFQMFNLNEIQDVETEYDVITCFETLEHVGNLNRAIDNLLNLKAKNGFLLIAVPIEIGWSGIFRVFWRTLRYGYNSGVCFRDFPQQKNLFIKYIYSLLTGNRISKFRGKRTHWSTHLGFDYRDVDEYLNLKQINFKTVNKDLERFYLIN